MIGPMEPSGHCPNRHARIDIAVAPLTDHVFNAAKSDLKWLESIVSLGGAASNSETWTLNIDLDGNGSIAMFLVPKGGVVQRWNPVRV